MEAELVDERDVGLVIIKGRERHFRGWQVIGEMNIRVELGEALFPKPGQPALREGRRPVDLDPAGDSLLRPVGRQVAQVEPAVGI